MNARFRCVVVVGVVWYLLLRKTGQSNDSFFLFKDDRGGRGDILSCSTLMGMLMGVVIGCCCCDEDNVIMSCVFLGNSWSVLLCMVFGFLHGKLKNYASYGKQRFYDTRPSTY